MYKIGIIAKPGRELTTIRAEISGGGYFGIQVFTDAPNAVSALKEKSLNALVIVLDSFSLKQLELVRKIRHIYPSIPMAFMAKSLDFSAQHQALKFPSVIALNAKFDLGNIRGILVRMVNGLNVHNRIDRRQPTMQSATIEQTESQIFESGCLLDLASNGARLRSFKNQYSRGDKIKLKIPLAFLRKTYEVCAEVVWSQNEPVTQSHPTNSQMLGLKFTSVLG